MRVEYLGRANSNIDNVITTVIAPNMNLVDKNLPKLILSTRRLIRGVLIGILLENDIDIFEKSKSLLSYEIYLVKIDTLVIPETINEIREDAIKQCEIDTLEIKSDIESLTETMINGCKINTLIIPESVTSLIFSEDSIKQFNKIVTPRMGKYNKLKVSSQCQEYVKNIIEFTDGSTENEYN